MSAKDRLLKLHSSGLYNKLAPEKALGFYHENAQYLKTVNSFTPQKELFDLTELQFYLALITGHDTEARLMLSRITDQFGRVNSERITILQSVYMEAFEGEKAAAEYLEKQPQFGKKLKVIKRRSFLTLKVDPSNFINDMLGYLEVQPGDAEAWYELSEVYLESGNYQQSIYCLEQALLFFPFAYNVYNRLGYVYHAYAYKILYDFSNTNNQAKRDSFSYNSATVEKFYTYYILALKNSLKAVELCESYYKGWAAVFKLTSPLELKNKNILNKLAPKQVEFSKLNKVAKNKLAEIVKNGWTDEDNEKIIKEIIA